MLDAMDRIFAMHSRSLDQCRLHDSALLSSNVLLIKRFNFRLFHLGMQCSDLEPLMIAGSVNLDGYFGFSLIDSDKIGPVFVVTEASFIRKNYRRQLLE
jgi:hypothetical protein